MPIQTDAKITTGSTPALITAALSLFLITLNATMVTTALPTIGTALGAGASLAWVLTGYSLVFAVFLLPAGTLADRIGASRAFLLGMTAFTVTSAICAIAGNLQVLLGARALQGAAAAVILPSGLALISGAFPDPRRRAKAIGQWSAAGAVALVVGSPAGGAITTLVGWQGTFWLTLPAGLLALTLALRLRLPPHHPVLRGPGAALLKEPAVLVSTATGFALNFASYGAIFVVTLYLQQTLDRSALTTGLVFVPMTALIIPANLLAGRLTTQYGDRRVLVIGQVLMIVGLLGLCTTGSGTALWSVTSWLLPIGAGAGLVAPAMTTMMLDGVPADRGGFGAGLLNAIRQLGSGAAPAVFGLLLTGSALTGLRTSLLIAAVVVVFSSALAFTRSERPSQRESPDS